MPTTSPNFWLALGAALSALAAALHLAVIAGGPAWYRFFGAGERLASAAERGRLWPHLVTFGIASVLAGWAAYAGSGAGLLPALPWLGTVLVAIAAVYTLRGLALVPALIFARGQVTPFVVWSSLICLAFGVVHMVGIIQAWPFE